MRTAAIILTAWLAVTAVRAQPPTASEPTPAQPAAPALIDESILVGTSARASKVIGSKVYRGDTVVGEIKDVLLDLNHATVPAVILATGGFLGTGVNEKQVAIPAAMIKVGKEARFTIDLTDDQLKAAPAFDPSKL